MYVVSRLRSGQMQWRLDDLDLRIPDGESLILARRALEELGWSTEQQLGLRIGSAVQAVSSEVQLRDAMERVRAGGKQVELEEMQRPALFGTWEARARAQAPPDRRVRRFVKEPSLPPAGGRPAARKDGRRPTERPTNDPSIDVQLFEDPVEQLTYEIRHYYLMTVPISQREQWPWPRAYKLMPSFLADVAEQSKVISRGQIVSAIVDVISGRVADVNSREARMKREGGGDDGRPVVMRSFDQAVAWRANIQKGPGARRIMWWRTPGGYIELARLAVHDDMELPER